MEILKLKPVLKELIWGGSRLREDFHMESGAANIAEDWALACHKDGKSIVENGPYAGQTLEAVIAREGSGILGSAAARFPYFPLLVKLIDARDNLSVQVHPDDRYAMEHEGEYGKTEMWYVVDCEPGASLVYGFREDMTRDQFETAIHENTLMPLLNQVQVRPGDVFFIESGTVHAIGKGILIAEIQQNSNTTYRVYDYNRKGADGKPRQLHVKKALDVSKTTVSAQPKLQPPVSIAGGQRRVLANCDLFHVEKWDITNGTELQADETSFLHLLVLDGAIEADGVAAPKGGSLFIPAGYGSVSVQGTASFLVSKL
ncbi:MAG: class I mannose-6-phosphate isomerase [Clostridiales bacterium]|nr:class I mannose-6-phosphate isomerase [Clostridiales bacterium]